MRKVIVEEVFENYSDLSGELVPDDELNEAYLGFHFGFGTDLDGFSIDLDVSREQSVDLLIYLCERYPKFMGEYRGQYEKCKKIRGEASPVVGWKPELLK